MTYGTALSHGRALLSESGVGNAAFDARLLLAAASGLDMATLIARAAAALPEGAAAVYSAHLKRRAAGEPVARILGEKEFWGLPFKVTPATLVPRPETETLVEVVLSGVLDRNARLTICDLGTGSGAILIALLRELPRAQGLGIDCSADALGNAEENARRLGVAERATFLERDFLASPERAFDVVVANPPYITTDTLSRLPREVRDHDPRAALDGGADGLWAYRGIVARLDGLLRPGGLVAFEVGEGQADNVAALCRSSGLEAIGIAADLAGVARVVTARKPLRLVEAGKKALGKFAAAG